MCANPTVREDTQHSKRPWGRISSLRFIHCEHNGQMSGGIIKGIRQRLSQIQERFPEYLSFIRDGIIETNKERLHTQTKSNFVWFLSTSLKV